MGRVDTATVADPLAFLVRTVSRLALDRLRRIAARRETYVGPWLPEPVLTGGPDDPAAEAERASSVSMAMLVVLETLTPLERTVFVLHEAFAYSYAEIAEIVDRSPAAVRQLAHRAREHVAARRPRFAADPAVRRTATERFLRASLEGDLAALLELLAPDATSVGRRRRQGEGTAAPDPRRRQDRPLLRRPSAPRRCRPARPSRSSRSTTARRRCWWGRPGRSRCSSSTSATTSASPISGWSATRTS